MTPRPIQPRSRALSRRGFLTLLGATTAATLCGIRHPALAREDTSSPPDSPVITQSRVGAAACGPCALANALSHGDPACRRAYRSLASSGGPPDSGVSTLIARYGSRPSETYGPRRGRFSPDAGLTAEDMPYLANDILHAANQPPALGNWLDAADRETGRDHLRRIHALLSASLARGFPPVLEVRSFAADSNPGKSTVPWVNLYAHWLALLDLQPHTLSPDAAGFSCRFADSYTGRIIPGFASVDLYRPFWATRGFSLRSDGTKDWHWLKGHPYVLLDLPDLPLMIQTRAPQERAFVALTYAVHR